VITTIVAPAGVQLFELREDRSETVSKPAAATLPARSQAAGWRQDRREGSGSH
jgi:hypothetical protein